jgi:hypothetical protein
MVFAARNSSKEMKLMRISRRLRRLEELNANLITTTTKFHKFGGIIECTYVLSFCLSLENRLNLQRTRTSTEVQKVQKIGYNLQDLNAERMEHDFCGSEFI